MDVDKMDKVPKGSFMKRDETPKKAENIGSNVEIISTETTEGEQFKNLCGIGSILRFKV